MTIKHELEYDLERILVNIPRDRHQYNTNEEQIRLAVIDIKKAFNRSLLSYEAIRAAAESKAIDDEGEYISLGDHLDYSGENKTHTVIKAALSAVSNTVLGKV